MPDYPYAGGDLLTRPNSYFYSAFGGAAFVRAWKSHREATAQWFDATGRASESVADTADPALTLFERLAEGDDRSGTIDAIARLVQRFEVTKRVYGAYDDRMRPVDREDYRVLERYVAFGHLLERTHARTGSLPALNALLKVNDILGAHREALAPAWRRPAARLVRAEREHVDALATRVGAAL